MARQENVKQHAVPRFLIAEFTDRDGRICVLNREVGREFRTTPINVGFERECYTVVRDRERDVSADDVNCSVEDRCAPHIQSLMADVPPTVEQWRSLWVLTGNLLLRSRRMRDSLTRLLNWAESFTAESEGLPGMSEPDVTEIRADLKRAAEVHHPATVACGLEPVLLELKRKVSFR